MKILCLLIFVLVATGIIIDRRVLVVSEVSDLSSTDSLNFKSIQRTFGNQNTGHKNNFISVYHMPTFGRKICYTVFPEKSDFEVVRKEIVAESLIWSGRTLGDSTTNGVLITSVTPSNQLAVLCSQLQDATEKMLKSERRVHLISRRPVTFPDEDIWFLEIERNGNLEWAKWYNDSKRRETIQNFLSKVEKLN